MRLLVRAPVCLCVFIAIGFVYLLIASLHSYRGRERVYNTLARSVRYIRSRSANHNNTPFVYAQHRCSSNRKRKIDNLVLFFLLNEETGKRLNSSQLQRTNVNSGAKSKNNFT